MKQEIINNLVQTLQVKEKNIKAVLSLLQEGNTVPFIARYRKEMTDSMDEEQIRLINKEYEYLVKLEQKKEETIKKIDEKEMLTDEIKKQILTAQTIQEIEDIYLPFKEKKKTKATEAIKNGLEPLAQYILNNQSNAHEEAQKYITDIIKDSNEALIGAQHIIAEIISDNAVYRQKIRDNIWRFGTLKSKSKKNIEELDERGIYEIYYDFEQKINKLPSYRILAINRGEKEKILNVKIDYDETYILEYIQNKETKKLNSTNQELVNEAIQDSLKRLILPSLTREIRKTLTQNADEQAIKIFATNLEKLIMQSPLKDKWILALDPAYRTGCKIAIIDNKSQMQEVGVIYPHEPKNDKENSTKAIKKLIEKYPIEQIVIGNGTASRETEEFIDELNLNIPYNLISEAGASVYSASKIAQEEFPDLTVEYRSAVSIGRRIQDPMAELVKIDPKSIGVGQYQHDVNQKELTESLDFVMIKSINQVGVDLNTASKELLQYVSGLDKGLAKNIVDYREENGIYNTRKELKKVKRLGEKAYVQSAGFLKIRNGKEILDSTFIHPEDYSTAHKIIDHFQWNPEAKIEASNEDYQTLEAQNITTSKINEIINYLNKPNLDIREKVQTAEFSRKIRKIEDLKEGDIVQGEVRNIVQFGAFVDIGLKNDALVHISELSNQFVSQVEDIVTLGDIKTFKIKEIDIKKGKIQLSLKDIN